MPVPILPHKCLYALAMVVAAAALSPTNVSAATVYVSLQTTGFVDAYNVNGTLEGTIDLGLNSPAGLVVDAAGNLFVNQFNTSTILEYNVVTGVISTFASMPANSGPFALAFDTSGNAYVATLTTGLVYKFDSSGVQQGSPVAVPDARGIEFNPNDGNLYVVSTGGGANDAIYQVTTGLVATLFVSSNGTDLVGPRYILFDGTLMLVSNTGTGPGGGFVEQFNGTTDGGVFQSLSGLDGPNQLTCDAGCANLYIAQFFGNNVLDDQGGTTTIFAGGPTTANGAAFSPVDPTFFVSVAPEPSTFVLMGAGLCGLAMFRRRLLT
jgi:hypothetical protein